MVKRSFVVISVIGLLATGSANASGDSNTTITFSAYAYPSFGQYAITLQSGTALWFNKVDHCNYGLAICGLYPSLGDYSTLTSTAWTVDTEMDVYLVPYGSELTMAKIESGQFSPLFTTDTPHSLDVPFGTFYLGVAAGGDFGQYGNIVGRSVYGWIELSNSAADGLSLINSGNSVYVGLPVPEPSTYSMMLASLGLIGYSARRRMA